MSMEEMLEAMTESDDWSELVPDFDEVSLMVHFSAS